MLCGVFFYQHVGIVKKYNKPNFKDRQSSKIIGIGIKLENIRNIKTTRI